MLLIIRVAHVLHVRLILTQCLQIVFALLAEDLLLSVAAVHAALERAASLGASG